jgi:membrane-bound lytic murein transglycosylase D
LRRWTTPVRYEYEVKVPVGTADTLRARLAEAPAAELTAVKWYTVRRGESLATIARKLKVRRVDLAEANSLSTRSRVRAGQTLVIPRAPATVLAARADRPEPPAIAASRALGSTETESPVVRTSNSRSERPARKTYRVRRGDTLISIARAFNTTVAQIKNWNGLRSNRITAGARLTIFADNSR